MNIEYRILKEARKRYSGMSFGNDRNVFIEGGKFVMRIVEKFDDPVGNWWQCDCGEKIFIPIFNIQGENVKQINYCPYCGEIITSFDKIEFCMEDSVIGTNLDKII